MNPPGLQWSMAECEKEHPALTARVRELERATAKKDHDFLKACCIEKGICPYRASGKKSAPKARIPPLKPASIPRFIAAIPRAVAANEITAAQGNHLLYAAQTLISLMRLEKPPPTPTPRPVGFTAPKRRKNAI